MLPWQQENGACSILSCYGILASQCPAQLGSSCKRGWAWEPRADARFCTNILLCYMDYAEYQLAPISAHTVPPPLRYHLAAQISLSAVRSVSLHVSICLSRRVSFLIDSFFCNCLLPYTLHPTFSSASI
jgi:hypothetical protein